MGSTANLSLKNAFFFINSDIELLYTNFPPPIPISSIRTKFIQIEKITHGQVCEP